MFIVYAESDNTDTAAVNSDDTGGTDRPDPQGPPAPLQPAPPFRVGGDQSGASLSKDESETLHYSNYMYLLSVLASTSRVISCYVPVNSVVITNQSDSLLYIPINSVVITNQSDSLLYTCQHRSVHQPEWFLVIHLSTA